MGIKCCKQQQQQQQQQQQEQAKHAKTKSSENFQSSGSKTEDVNVPDDTESVYVLQDVKNSSERGHTKDEVNKNNECVQQNIYENMNGLRDQCRLQIKENKHKPHGYKSQDKENKELTDSYRSQTNESEPKSNDTAEHMYVNGPQIELNTKKKTKKMYKNTKDSDDYVPPSRDSEIQFYDDGQSHSLYDSIPNNKACKIYL